MGGILLLRFTTGIEKEFGLLMFGRKIFFSLHSPASNFQL